MTALVKPSPRALTYIVLETSCEESTAKMRPYEEAMRVGRRRRGRNMVGKEKRSTVKINTCVYIMKRMRRATLANKRTMPMVPHNAYIAQSHIDYRLSPSVSYRNSSDFTYTFHLVKWTYLRYFSLVKLGARKVKKLLEIECLTSPSRPTTWSLKRSCDILWQGSDRCTGILYVEWHGQWSGRDAHSLPIIVLEWLAWKKCAQMADPSFRWIILKEALENLH